MAKPHDPVAIRSTQVVPGNSLPAVGSKVRLRDLTLDDADLLDAWARDPLVRGEFNTFGTDPSSVDREALARGPLRNERNGELMVERLADGQPIGSVNWHRVSYGPNAGSAAWNIGISLIPAARGQGSGSEAQRLLADYLFAATEFHGVQAATDVDNTAEHRALERAGFVREGLLRGAQERSGVRHDLINYARLRTDP